MIKYFVKIVINKGSSIKISNRTARGRESCSIYNISVVHKATCSNYLFVDRRPLWMTHGCLPPGRAEIKHNTQHGYRSNRRSGVNVRSDISLEWL